MADPKSQKAAQKRGSGGKKAKSADQGNIAENLSSPTAREVMPSGKGSASLKHREFTQEANGNPQSRLAAYEEKLIAALTAVSQAEGMPEQSSSLELLLFMMGDKQFAIEAKLIIHVVEPRKVARVPNAPAAVEGIISVRGTIVPLINARARLGQTTGGHGRESRIVVIEDSLGRAGFMVDRILRVVKLQPWELEESVHSIDGRRSTVRATFRSGESSAGLIDSIALLSLSD